MTLTLSDLKKAHLDLEQIFTDIESQGKDWVFSEEQMGRYHDAKERSDLNDWIIDKLDRRIQDLRRG